MPYPVGLAAVNSHALFGICDNSGLPGRNNSFHGTKMRDNVRLHSNYLHSLSILCLTRACFGISTARTTWSEQPGWASEFPAWLSSLHGHIGAEDLQLLKGTAHPIFYTLYVTCTLLLNQEKIPIVQCFQKCPLHKLLCCMFNFIHVPKANFALREKRGYTKEGQWSLDPCSVLAASIQHAKQTWTLVFQISCTTLVSL